MTTEITPIRKKRETCRTDASNLKKLIEQRRWTNATAAVELGYSDTAISAYLRDNDAPEVLDKLCACLLLNTNSSAFYAVLVPAEKREAFAQFCAAIGISVKEVV